MQILITGIAGHLGSSFAKWVKLNKPEVGISGIDNLSSGYIENLPKDIEFYNIDLVNLDSHYKRIFSKTYDYVFHFAAYAAEGLSPFVRSYNYKNNLIATTNVVNAILNSEGTKRLLYTSSMAALGKGEVPFKETDICAPIDPYGVAKLSCEMDIRIAGEQHNLDWCVLRPHNIYGPGQSIWQKYRNVLGLWMRAVLENKPVLIYGDGNQQRAFSYIDDILPSIWNAAEKKEASKQIIHLGGPEPISINEAALTLEKVVGSSLNIQHKEPRHEVKDAWCTTEKSEKILDYQYKINLEIGLKSMWDWAQEEWKKYPQRNSMKDSFSLELEKGIYSYWKS